MDIGGHENDDEDEVEHPRWHHEVVALTSNLQKELAKLREACKDSDDKIPEYGLAPSVYTSCSVTPNDHTSEAAVYRNVAIASGEVHRTAN